MHAQDLDETTHVGALELMREIYRHLETGDRVLFLMPLIEKDDRVLQVSDPDPIERNAAPVGMVLNVVHCKSL
jgi:hypothetical protein